MNAKRWILWSALSVVVVVVLGVVIVAAGVGSEASSLKDTLDQAVTTHSPALDLKQKLTAMGYQLDVSPGQSLAGAGRKHSLAIYSTWLTVRVTMDEQGRSTGYKMDRQQAWF